MSQPPLEAIRSHPDGTPVARREIAGIIAMSLLRLVLGFGLIVVMMNAVPEEPGITMAAPIAVAVIGTAGYIWFFVHQVKGVYKAKYPTLRAAEALVMVAAMFLAVFAMVYVMVSHSAAGSFTEQLDSFTGYYFALTVLATVGFGDITPVSTAARSVTMAQMAFDIAFIAVLIRVMGGAARKALAQRAQDLQGPPGGGNA